MDLEPLPPDPDFVDPALPVTSSVVSPVAGSDRRFSGPARMAVAGAAALLVASGIVVGVSRGGGGAGVTTSNAAASGPAPSPHPTGAARPTAGRHRRLLAGKAGAVTNGTFTLTDPMGRTTKVATNATTSYDRVKAGTGALADVKPGQQIVVQGTPNGSGLIAAKLLFLLPKPAGPKHNGTKPAAVPARRPVPAGTVKSNDNGTLTVTRADGSAFKVTTSATTVVIERVPASLTDVANSFVVVVGTPDATGLVTATSIEIVPGGPAGGLLHPFRPGFGPGPGGFRGRRAPASVAPASGPVVN